MAITAVARGSGAGYANNPTISDVFEPTPGNVLVVAAASWTGFMTGVTGWANTVFSEIVSITQGRDLKLFAAIVGASPGSDSATLTTTTNTNHSACVIEVSGLDTSGTIQDIFVQDISQGDYDPPDPFALEAGFPLGFSRPDNGTLMAMYSEHTPDIFTPMVGHEVIGFSRTIFSVELHLYDGEETDPVLSGYQRYVNIAGIACEILGGAAVSGPDLRVLRRRGR